MNVRDNFVIPLGARGTVIGLIIFISLKGYSCSTSLIMLILPFSRVSVF